MALLYMDSFDHYVTADIAEKWTVVLGPMSIQPTSGRRASACVRLAGQRTLFKPITNASSTIVIGAAVKVAAAASVQSILGIHDGTATRDHVLLTVSADGTVTAMRSNTTGMNPGSGMTALGASASGVLPLGTVAYVECVVTLHDTLGAVAVRVNGTPVITLANVDTANTTTAWTGIWLGATGGSAVNDFDDLYVLDGSGAAPWNTFLGDCRVDARWPTAAGATTGWTPLAGANWDAVNDAAPDDDTTYTTATTTGLTDTFVTQDAPVVGAVIYGVQHCLNMKKTDAGACTVVPVIRHGGADFAGAAINPGTAYAYGVQIAATNPGTGAAWTEAGFNAAEFGYKRTV